MALKERKFIHYTEEEKNEIIQKHVSGISRYYLAKEYGVLVGTIKI